MFTFFKWEKYEYLPLGSYIRLFHVVIRAVMIDILVALAHGTAQC